MPFQPLKLNAHNAKFFALFRPIVERLNGLIEGYNRFDDEYRTLKARIEHLEDILEGVQLSLDKDFRAIIEEEINDLEQQHTEEVKDEKED